MALDGMVTRALAMELATALNLGKIDKIHQPEKDELVFIIHTNSGKRKLYASSNSNHPGVFLSEESYQNPPQASSFCMLLRKHLSGGRIHSVSQVGAERIIEITLETRDELGFGVNKKLIFEIMGRHSNIILVHEETGKIVDSIKRVTADFNRVRQVLPGQIYSYPPLQNKIAFDQVENLQLPPKEPDLSSFLLGSIQGISPSIAKDLSMEPSSFAIEKTLRNMADNIACGNISPRVYLPEQGPAPEFHLFPLNIYEALCKPTLFPSISQAICHYYQARNISNRVKQKSLDLLSLVTTALKKLYLKQDRLREDLCQAEKADMFRLYGELITANLHQIKSGDSKVNLNNYYNGETVTIALDIRLSPAKNASHYYKKYSKAKRAIKEKNSQLEEVAIDITYLESVLLFIEMATSVEEIDSIRAELAQGGIINQKKKKATNSKEKLKPKLISYTTTDGFSVLVGRNNIENDYLTFTKSGRKDLWFHTKDIPGSHVILLLENKEPTASTLMQVASIAAYHSKAQNSENVAVDYMEQRYVKKPRGAKAGMVIFTNNKTLYVNPSIPKD